MNAATHDLLRKRIDQLLLVQKGKELDLKVDPDVTKQHGEHAAPERHLGS